MKYFQADQDEFPLVEQPMIVSYHFRPIVSEKSK